VVRLAVLLVALAASAVLGVEPPLEGGESPEHREAENAGRTQKSIHVELSGSKKRQMDQAKELVTRGYQAGYKAGKSSVLSAAQDLVKKVSNKAAEGAGKTEPKPAQSEAPKLVAVPKNRKPAGKDSQNAPGMVHIVDESDAVVHVESKAPKLVAVPKDRKPAGKDSQNAPGMVHIVDESDAVVHVADNSKEESAAEKAAASDVADNSKEESAAQKAAASEISDAIAAKYAKSKEENDKARSHVKTLKTKLEHLNERHKEALASEAKSVAELEAAMKKAKAQQKIAKTQGHDQPGNAESGPKLVVLHKGKTLQPTKDENDD
jgi:hypothetical protein